MSSTFSGLSTALNALMAQRAGLTVTGQNIANANTVGYSRQRAELAALAGATQVGLNAPPLIDRIGSGVTVDSIRRLADAFVDARQRDSHANSSYATAQQAAFTQIETVLGEPSDTGLSAQLSQFWSSWKSVANAPDSIPARQGLLSKAATVAGTLSGGRAAVDAAYADTRTQLDALVTDVNTTAQGIASINDKIRIAAAAGDSPNELVDQRDQLVLKLSELVGARVTQNDDGTVSLSVNGVGIVSSSRANTLKVSGGQALGTSALTLEWDGVGPATFSTGQVGGVVDALKSTYPAAAKGFEDVAKMLADTVNAAHAQGQDLQGVQGTDVFSYDPTDVARTLKVAITDPRLVAAADLTSPAPPAPPTPTLDGSNADAIAQLASSKSGADAVWSAFVAATGVSAASAETQVAVHQAISQQADGARASTSGVSLDEEMANMLMYQRAYEGAGRMMTAVDQMLDTLINRTGLVGR
jgi:flagellar hook-associated protein 1 FlgK